MEEELYYPSSENKGADQLRGYREADLRLCFRLGRLLVFSRGGSYIFSVSISFQSETMSAEVGDRFIFLRSRGEYGRPVIEIMRFKSDRQMGREFTGDRIDRITYKD